MRAHLYQWQVRIASAFLLALMPQVGTLRAAKAAPDLAVSAPTAQQPIEQQSIERSRMKLGLPPTPDMEDHKVHNRKGPAADQAILKAKFEEAKRNADTLAELAQSLKSDLDKGNENVVSLLVVKKAEKIEKLAEKIKKWGKAY